MCLFRRVEPALFCSSVAMSEPAWLHPEELSLEAGGYLCCIADRIGNRTRPINGTNCAFSTFSGRLSASLSIHFNLLTCFQAGFAGSLSTPFNLLTCFQAGFAGSLSIPFNLLTCFCPLSLSALFVSFYEGK